MRDREVKGRLTGKIDRNAQEGEVGSEIHQVELIRLVVEVAQVRTDRELSTVPGPEGGEGTVAPGGHEGIGNAEQLLLQGAGEERTGKGERLIELGELGALRRQEVVAVQFRVVE